MSERVMAIYNGDKLMLAKYTPPLDNTSDSGWCPSCTCGWHKPIDAFDVTPPETECRNTVCQCHQGFWDTDPVLVVESFDELDDRSFDELEDELTKRRLWGDR